jgi:hypothetical protein
MFNGGDPEAAKEQGLRKRFFSCADASFANEVIEVIVNGPTQGFTEAGRLQIEQVYTWDAR